MRVQGRSSHRSTDARRQHSHGRKAAFELLDLGMVLTIGHQLTLLGNEAVLVALQAINFHQLQTQIAALGLALDRLLQHISRLVQVTTVDMRLSLCQRITGILRSDSNRQRREYRGNRRRHHDRLNRRRGCGRSCQLDVRWRDFQAFEAVRWQVVINVRGKYRLFSQGPRHT